MCLSTLPILHTHSVSPGSHAHLLMVHWHITRVMRFCVSKGLQEYVEAVSFYHYLKDGTLVTLSQVEKDLKFPRSSATELAQQKAARDYTNPAAVPSSTSASCSAADTAASADKLSKDDNILTNSVSEVSSSSDSVAKEGSKDPRDRCTDNTISVTVPPMEFMLGIADLTGELMRTAIMSVSAGNLDYPVQICDFMRIIHDSFMSYGNTARELTRKMATLRQSLQKVENACYTLKVRGSEIPKHMLADIFTASSSEGPFTEDVEGSSFD